ncbi:hypothetical protein SAMN05216228_1010126 [Rhizobium tibeticum]|uniref:Uncharacterized protein n=1 Tax=Rhizobium tibeticum TaxID=501024 RepID=A0A1H8L605_9HYPH|nr:hypothetical protein [Rhizobium tibeticum]SEH86551.1 hypothetical protein RTCCBAU85039_2767 [Rhizobium tibeticum]SEO00535.1 hypothetical protein SAMN05216228_1010126 [Rhizobium tibeticum]
MPLQPGHRWAAVPDHEVEHWDFSDRKDPQQASEVACLWFDPESLAQTSGHLGFLQEWELS